MTTHQQRVEFVNRFIAEYPERAREECVRAAGMLLRLSARHLELQREVEKGWAQPFSAIDGERLIRRARQLKERIEGICAPFRLPVELGSDPRACTVRVLFPSNTRPPNGDRTEVPQ